MSESEPELVLELAEEPLLEADEDVLEDGVEFELGLELVDSLLLLGCREGLESCCSALRFEGQVNSSFMLANVLLNMHSDKKNIQNNVAFSK